MSGRPINIDRQNAIALELTTYTGAVHRKCGTNQRYVSGGGCIHCARLIATEQRDARKFLKQHAINEAEAKVREDDGIVLDIFAGDGLDTDEPDAQGGDDDADARFQESIEDLM